METGAEPLLGPFADLPDGERDQFTRLAVRRVYPAGALIWSRGESADHLLVLQSGLVAVQSGERHPSSLGKAERPAKDTEPAERTLTLAVLGAEDVLGEMALAGVPRRTADAVALTETTALLVQVQPLRAMRLSDPEVDNIVMAILADTVRRLTDQVIEATFVPQPVRLRQILLRLGRLTHDQAIAVTHAQLAEMLGAQRTTVTELLAAEVAAGRIQSGRGRIRILDEPALREAARG